MRRDRIAGVGLVGALLVSLSGCATLWEDVTSRDFQVKALFVKDDPLVVLRDSKDGDKRARAYADLPVPSHARDWAVNGDFVVELLSTAAKSEAQFYPRLVAVERLGSLKGCPKPVAPALVEAYYNAGAFSPENAAVLRCKALTALGALGDPAGAELLVKVLRQGPVEGPEDDRRRALDERIAAARALASFPRVASAEALVHVLRTEKDVALRVAAHEALRDVTGQDRPPDALAWAEYVEGEKSKGTDALAGRKKGVGDLIQASFSWLP